MPNYVRNIVKMKGIADLPLYNERPGEKYFDFQKLIPMPAELDVEDGSRTEQRIIYFLTERCTIPVRDLDQRKSDLVRKLVSNDFAKMDWPEEVFNRTLNWMSGATDEERDNAYEGGRQYISNYETHGFTTWYGWCRHNWGTKWNACETQIIDSDTIVFDKTGTLTKAQPTVVDVVSFNGDSGDDLLRLAACMEEHFPHSMAKAVVDAAREKYLDHEEMHSKVEYIVAHGISTTINGKKAIIGSYHFVFEDENSIIPEGMEEKFRHLPEEYSHLYLALEGVLAAVICIEDPLRPEAAEIIRQLKKTGLKKIVMMTGDSERTAKAIAKKVGVDEYYAEVLPEDKANFVEKEKVEGRKVIMIGDGINDSPALSAADVGIAISEGAEIAREIADITVAADDLAEILVLRMLSNRLMKRIHKNYRFIVTFNAGLILLGVGGILQPTTSALLHNTSTLYIGLKSMGNLLDEPV